jgi:ribosomal 50S subunit-associated protein YjgA (DUF615 family)
MKKPMKNGKRDPYSIGSSGDSALEDLLRLAPEVSDEHLSSLLLDYAEERKQEVKPRQSRSTRIAAPSK